MRKSLTQFFSLALLSCSATAADFYAGVGVGFHQGRFYSPDFPLQSYLNMTTEYPRPNDMHLDRQAKGGIVLMGLLFPQGYKLEMQLRNSQGFRYEGKPFMVDTTQAIDYKTKSLILRGTAPVAEVGGFKVSAGLGISFNKATENSSLQQAPGYDPSNAYRPLPPTFMEAQLRGYLNNTSRQFGYVGRKSSTNVSPIVSLDFDYELNKNDAIRLELDFKNAFGKKLSSPGRVDVYSAHLMYVHYFK